MIIIRNLTKIAVDKNFLKKVAKIVLKGENIDIKKRDISIVLVQPDFIRKLNQKYRKINKPTDILSFGGGGLNEIVICLEIVKRNAKKFKSSFKKELTLVLIHGILHLLGYDHPDGVEDPRLININRDEKTNKETEKMEKKEKFYLSKIIKK